MLKILKVFISAILIAYLLIFTVNNQESIVLKIFSDSTAYSIPLFLLVIICVFIGILIGTLIMYGEKMAVVFQLRKLNKELKTRDNEIERLKKITFSESVPDKDINTANEIDKTVVEQNNENQQENSDIKDVIR